ncbi:MAG: sigma-70 family RNA polymerase sigma factor [Alphaproteobacteria bacterium]|nr:sigma-70 family RNA polymerase sigma factor [Alphaproteobacteria bacterium]
MTVFHSELETLLPDLTRFARSLTRSEDDAYDLVQDCVERALLKKEYYEDGTNLKSWLFTMMRNLFISQKRREAVARRYVKHIDSSGDRVQRPSQMHHIFLKETMSAIDELSTAERDAVVMLGVEETSHRDASQFARLPVGTVKSRLSRGRANLRTALGLGDAVLVPV